MNISIKLSGAALSSDENSYTESVLKDISKSIKILLGKKHKISITIGGGNLFRGKDITGKLSIKNTTGDYIGMLATIQNSLVLKDYFESQNINARISSAITMPQIAEPYIPQRVLRHLEKDRVVIFSGGLGVPFFTTDSAAVLRALETKADFLVMAKDGVDGLYTDDPKKDTGAKKIDKISASAVLEKNLKVADSSAIALAREKGLKIRIVSIADLKNLEDETVGSTIIPE